jgi:protein-tyrosine phosphatase
MNDNDPTAIPINLDPRQRRMSGVAYHGNTPFDVPFISQIEGDLYQGGCMEGLVLPHNIDKVLSLYPWEQYYIDREDVERVEVRMYDSETQAFDQVDELAEMVNRWLNEGFKVLVHCQAGLNRSSLVAARVLMLRGKTADEAINLLRTNRSPACLCNPAFEAHLRGLEKYGPGEVMWDLTVEDK